MFGWCVRSRMGSALVALALSVFHPFAAAGEPLFGYSYLTDTLPAGKREFEQWATLHTGKQQGEFSLLRLRSGYEYGMTDALQLSGYLNYYHIQANGHSVDGLTEGGFENFVPENHDPNSPYRATKVESLSLEVIYRIWSPYKDPLGLALYLEPSLGQENRTLEGGLLLQKNFMDDRLVLVANLKFEREWRLFTGNPNADPADEEFNRRWVKEQELIMTYGASYRFAPSWFAGFEVRNETEYHALNFERSNRDFQFWSAGPTLHYGAKDWFLTLSYQRQLANARVYNEEISDWLHQGRIYGDEATRNEVRVKFGYYF